ncbi:hypothetical protein [Streptomyces sp. NPDC057877]|uniref:hypothetical protein n=1 Tax=Streptomyces sp. NPDC057877 TaxID=3346269 RepID=UPI00367879D5
MTGAEVGGFRVRRYRGSLVTKVLVAAVLLVVAGALATFAVLLLRVAKAPFVVALPFTAFAALCLAGMVSFLSSGTVVDQDGITVHDAGTVRTAWRDIVAIEIEENSFPVGETIKTVDCVVLYTRHGRRIALAEFTSSRTLSVPQEARVLRELWERRRGEDWTGQPDAVRAGRERSAAGQRMERSVTGAMGCVSTVVRVTVFGVLVVCLIALATGKGDDLPGAGTLFALVLGGVVVVAGGTALAARVLGDRDR